MAYTKNDGANGSSKPTPPTAHPRDEVIRKAQQELDEPFYDLVSRHELTLAEAVLLLSIQMSYLMGVVVGTERSRG